MATTALQRPTEGQSDRAERAWRLAWAGTVFFTWCLMVLGAATRAFAAGVACPDWPLCHGYLIPPADASAYPPEPMYQVYRVFLEFSHRVLAALVAIGSIALGVHAFRRGARQIALGLWSLLALQVMAGATTVWLRNVPVSVVLHLAVGMGFLAVLLVVPTRVFSPSARARRAAPGRGFEMVLALLVSQMLVGGVISSRGLGLACSRFPLCEGAPWPDTWTMPAAWQMLHRILGLALLLGSLFLWIRAAARAAPAAERRLSGELFAGTCAQVLLGGLNVWTLLAPAVSAAHLGLAVLLFALLVLRLEQGQTAGLPEAAPA